MDVEQAVWPPVSVIVPVRNEERDIDACLRAIRAQDYPSDLLEIVVVDGMSEDRTRTIVQGHAVQDSRVRLLLSPRRRTPYALNIALAAAHGEVVVRVDGHSLIAPDHVRRGVAFLLRSGVDHAGGLMRVRGRGYVGRAIADALSSPVGVGNARFRYTQREQDIDTVPFGAYRRETLLRLGGFDERFHIGQDSELDYRIILSGGRVRISPAIATDYYCRESLSALARQFYRYGRAKAQILHKHHGLPSARALAPAGLVGTLGMLALAAPFYRLARRALAALTACYALLCLLAAAGIAARRGWRAFPLLPIVLMVLHGSHGLGFLGWAPRFLTPRPAERLRGSLPLVLPPADHAARAPSRAAPMEANV